MVPRAIRLTISLFLAGYCVTAAGSIFAQGMCDVRTFRLDKVKGRVVSDGPKGDEPIQHANVKLFRTGKNEAHNSLVASVAADENGFFEISKVKKGSYRLEVSKPDSGFRRHISAVNVFGKSENSRLLLIRLGVGFDWKGCGEATLIKK